jgi:hypothetical protein
MSGTAPTPQGGYERSDVDIRRIVQFAVGLAVATAASLALMGWLYRSFEGREARQDAAQQPATRIETGERRPPEPVLQGAPGSRFELQPPRREVEALRREEQASLGSSAWVDRNAGVVRIPIEHAKRLLLERGLPVRERPAGEATEVRP